VEKIAKYILKYNLINYILEKCIIMKPSIVLDIDETLIHTYIYQHSYVEYLNSLPDLEKNIYLDKNPELKNVVKHTNVFYDALCLICFKIDNYVYIVMMRPYLCEFIQKIDKYFDIYVYSLGTIDYIYKILNALSVILDKFPFKKIIANVDVNNRFFKKSVSHLDIGYSNILIIDDRSDVWRFDKHLLYKINPYKSAFDEIDDHLEDSFFTSSDIIDEIEQTKSLLAEMEHKSLPISLLAETKSLLAETISLLSETESVQQNQLDDFDNYIEKIDIKIDQLNKQTEIFEFDDYDYLESCRDFKSNKRIVGRFTILEDNLNTHIDINTIVKKKKLVRSTDIELLKLSNLIEKYFSIYPSNNFNIKKFKNLILNNDYFKPIYFINI